MIEIIFIFFFSLFICFFFKLPFYSIFFHKKFNKDLADADNKEVFNFLLISNIILILSLLNLNLNKIILIIFIIALISFFFLKNKKNIFKLDFKSFSLLFLSTLLIFIDIAHNPILYFDAQKVWLPKALIFLNNGTISDLNSTSNPYYPHFGPLLWSFFLQNFYIKIRVYWKSF